MLQLFSVDADLAFWHFHAVQSTFEYTAVIRFSHLYTQGVAGLVFRWTRTSFAADQPSLCLSARCGLLPLMLHA
jgi:hypothetical protein